MRGKVNLHAYLPTHLPTYLQESASVDDRRKAVVVFNKEHRYRKRGLSAIPTKFGISFTAKFMNQVGR